MSNTFTPSFTSLTPKQTVRYRSVVLFYAAFSPIEFTLRAATHHTSISHKAFHPQLICVTNGLEDETFTFFLSSCYLCRRFLGFVLTISFKIYAETGFSKTWQPLWCTFQIERELGEGAFILILYRGRGGVSYPEFQILLPNWRRTIE